MEFAVKIFHYATLHRTVYLPIGENPSCFPSTHEGRKKSHDQSRAVKEHVKSI